MSRNLKIIVALAMSCTAIFAISGVAAGSASASTLCLSSTSPCPAASKAPVGTVLNGTQLGTGVLTASSGVQISCTGSTFSDKITSNPGVNDEVTALAFSGCTESVLHTACTVKVGTSPTLPSILTFIKAGTTGPNGSAKIEKLTATVECPSLGVTCVYAGAATNKSVTGELFNPNDTNKPVTTNTHAQLRFLNTELTSVTGGSTCGTANAKENTVYQVVTSTGADVWIAAP